MVDFSRETYDYGQAPLWHRILSVVVILLFFKSVGGSVLFFVAGIWPIGLIYVVVSLWVLWCMWSVWHDWSIKEYYFGRD